MKNVAQETAQTIMICDTPAPKIQQMFIFCR